MLLKIWRRESANLWSINASLAILKLKVSITNVSQSSRERLALLYWLQLFKMEKILRNLSNCYQIFIKMPSGEPENKKTGLSLSAISLNQQVAM